MPKHSPNIVFIMADDHAAHAMRRYGSAINRTPNPDRIATGERKESEWKFFDLPPRPREIGASEQRRIRTRNKFAKARQAWAGFSPLERDVARFAG